MTARDDYPAPSYLDRSDAMYEVMCDEIDRLRVATFVRPGDTLIVNVGFDHPAAECLAFKDQIMARLPGVNALVLTAKEMIVYRP